MMDFLTNGNGWLILGLGLIIIEMVLNLAYISISFGIGSILTGLLIKLNLIPTLLDSGVIDELLIVGIISVIALIALRALFNKKSDQDINQY
jgi:membrane protein implicated in regulation of membrane protease activity